MKATTAVLQLAHAASLRRSWKRFLRASEDPESAQRSRLEAVLRSTASSRRGERLGLQGIDGFEAFQARVPVVRYPELADDIGRIAAGARGVLTASEVRMLEPTSGSTGTYKLVPYTRELFDEFSDAISPWLYDLYRHHPRLYGTRSYWAISPPARRPERTEGGLPIGLPSDTAYFGAVARWALERMMAVPGDVARIGDIDLWRDVTCRHLLAASDLGLVSVWSPTFLTLLMQHIEAHWARLWDGVPGRDAAERRLERAGRITGEVLWPHLGLISCWTDGPSQGFADDLSSWFPSAVLQGKGLMATEGVVSIPVLGAPGAVLAVASHFLEFVDLEHPDARPALAHELRVGGEYAPLLSTSGGFLRYDLGDVVRCVGHFRATPAVRFVGRRDQTSDLCGEKLGVPQVTEALARARRELGMTPLFALLTPSRDRPPRYALYLEAQSSDEDLGRFGEVVEHALAEGYHYAACRRLGQLGPVRVVRVEGGWDRWVHRMIAEGRRLGDLKPAPLDLRDDWGATFSAGQDPAPSTPPRA